MTRCVEFEGRLAQSQCRARRVVGVGQEGGLDECREKLGNGVREKRGLVFQETCFALGSASTGG